MQAGVAQELLGEFPMTAGRGRVLAWVELTDILALPVSHGRFRTKWVS